ncbi:MAG: hypothetical protein J7647_06455 [Cyanobacteria bacterium SBLK]|nr:hypothetical protein [Cyanobacteria bacterium SBLK]
MTTATALQLSPQQLTLTARVATWDCFKATEYQASDIATVSIRENIVWIQFKNNTATAIDTDTFKAKIEEYKAESQLSEEQQEIIEAAIASLFQSEVNFQNAIASFYMNENRFMGTVRKERFAWKAAIAADRYSYHKTAEQAIQFITNTTH